MALRILMRHGASDIFNKYNGLPRLLATKSVKPLDDESEAARSLRYKRMNWAVMAGEKFVETDNALIEVPEIPDAGLVSGVPEEHIKTRRVRIYQPAKSAMQSGTNNIHFWQIDFDTRERWENPLMGWTSSGDPMSNIKVDFASAEEAVLHCKKMGWEYYIQEPNKNDPKPRSYGTNFAWNKRTRVSTK